MGPFRLFGPQPIVEESDGTTELPGVVGALTAREALAAILPAVRQVDRAFVLRLVTSGEDIDQRGRATVWEFFFDFPRRRARGIFSITPCDVEVEPSRCCLRAVVRPKQRETGIAAQLVESLKHDRAALAYVRRVWREAEAREPVLPLDFRDSPEAVRALADQGADWISGSTSMTLSSKRLPSGELVWSTLMYDDEFRTPFAGGV
jgi:hypothetical protein